MSGNGPWRPTYHDYVEKNKISTSRMEKKDVEESRSHQNEGEPEGRWGQGGQAGRPPPGPIRCQASDRGLNRLRGVRIFVH